MDIMGKYSDNDSYIEACLDEGKDIYGRIGKQFEYEFINPSNIGLPNVADIIKEYPTFFKNKVKYNGTN